MRLNVFLQKAGIGSRREAERLVASGVVKINGVIAEPTTPVNDGDVVLVNDKPVAPDIAPTPRLFRLYKPLDYITTTFDKENRKTVFDLPCFLTPNLPRLMYVGRLDVNSEGLLLLSTDGKLAQRMMHPSSELPRLYRIRVHGRLTAAEIKQLAKGVTVEGVDYKGAQIEEEKEPTGENTWYRITLTEGKNREIRRLMEHFGCVVNRLIRLQYGPFELGSLARGELREVPTGDVMKFMATLPDVELKK